jgi:PAS domain S-box-containing protein
MLNKIIEKSSDLIYVLNTDKKILRANKAAEKILGYIPSQLTGNLYREYIHKDDYKKWEKATAKVISGESVPDFEQRFIHKNGYEVLLTCSLLYDSNEERIYCIANEIPGRVKAEKEIKKSEEKYQILFDLSPIPKYVYDLQTLRIIDVNRAAIDHYGYSKEEFLKLKIQDLRLKSDIPRLLKSIEKYQTSSGIIRFGVYSHLKKDGSITKMDISGQKFIYDGQTRIMVIANDVTQQHNDQKQKRLLADIRQIFSQQQRLKNVLKDVLAHLVNSGEFHLGEIWMTSRDQNLLNLTTIYPKSDFTSAFYELSSDIKTIKNGEGLPGSVWSSKKREIWDHLGDKSRFIRSDAAKETGLESAMGIPLIYNEEVLGVLLLGSKKSGDVLDSTKYLFSDLETIIGSELKRKQLEEDYNQIFNTAPDIICMIDFEGSFKRINPEGSKLLGYSEDELLNMPYIEFVHPDDRAVFKNQLEESFQSDTTIKLTHRVVPISGNFIWLDWSIRQTTEEGISYGVAKNITELKELQKLLDEATDLARIGGWHLDLISKEVYWSPMTRKLHEVGEEFEPDLESGINFYREDVRDKVKEYVDQAISSGDSWNFELPIITAKGREIWIKSIGKVEYKDGSPIRMVGSLQDITKTKSYEESLQNLNENLEKHAKELAISNRELEQFAFVTSHDLQEPLRMISSFLAQLEKKYGDQLDEKAHQYIYFAVDGAKRMRQIILDLLDFSKIGKSNDLKENVDLEEIVQETCQLQRKAIEESSAIVIKENLPTILAERAVIAQIFQNLIGNAIKYRKEGVPPKVKISAKELNEEWIISVEDNGIGIHEEYFGKIFTIFQKLHEKERYDGTGMGLAIVKKSVENLGGKIWVESTPSKGSTFKFSIKK